MDAFALDTIRALVKTRIRIVTWNIHKGIGTDRRYALERTIQVLRDLDADVVCLQEADHGVSRSAYENQKKRLRRELGYPHATFKLNVKVEKGGYGNLTLSKFPITAWRNVDLTIPPKKRRSGLVARLEVRPGVTWVVANVHLGLMHLERKVQVRRLLHDLVEDAEDDEPLVIAGDWNEWGTRLTRSVMKEWGLHLARTDHRPWGERTWPSRRPLVALDKILYRDPVRCHHVVCVLDEVTRVASDHVPLMVELEA